MTENSEKYMDFGNHWKTAKAQGILESAKKQRKVQESQENAENTGLYRRDEIV